jgi:GR25 family glycosyltransferase involved in LPS biosynthesis
MLDIELNTYTTDIYNSIKEFIYSSKEYNNIISLIIFGIIILILNHYFHKIKSDDIDLNNNIVKWNQHYYINLDHREDRKKKAIKEFKKIGLDKPNRFRAIKNDIHGGIGCGLSHIGVLEKAKEHNWDYVIIMEDDIKFYDPKQTFQKINNIFLSNVEWDVMIIGSKLKRPYQKINDDCVRVYGGITSTIMYIVKNHYYDTLINFWKKYMISFENTMLQNINNLNSELLNEIYNNHSIDQVWKQLQKKDKFISIIPNKVYEHGYDKSDIWEARSQKLNQNPDNYKYKTIL